MHAENGIVINEIIKRALEKGHTAPKYHALTRPTVAEAEGVHRAIAIAEMADHLFTSFICPAQTR
jgi:dihydropyrimidinase